MKNVIARSVDEGGATTSVERTLVNGQDTLVVTRREDVTEALRQAAFDRENEIRTPMSKGLGGFKVGEFPQTILMEMGKKHGVWYGMEPALSECADKKELYKKFCRVVEDFYPMFKSTNRKLV